MEKDFSNRKRFIEYVPDVCKSMPAFETDKVTKFKSPVLDENGNQVMIEPTFTGSIILRKPDFEERALIIESMGVEVSDDGEVDMKFTGMKSVLRMAKQALPFYEKVDLVRIEDGERFESYEDLSYDTDCDSIIVGASTALLQGNKVSKNSKP